MRDHDGIGLKAGVQMREEPAARTPGRQTRVETEGGEARGGDSGAVGRRTQVEASFGGGGDAGDGARARSGTGASATDIAAQGMRGPGQALPFGDRIQRLFGRHDVSGVQAHVGGEAGEAARTLGARAYAHGNSVAFGEAPDLHTAAHEAAHVVQRQGGLQYKKLDGGSGDPHERHADAVADAVVAGRSAEALLDRSPGGAAPAVQRKTDDAPTPGAPAPGGDPKDRGGRPAKGAGGAVKTIPAKGGGGGAIPGGKAGGGAAGGGAAGAGAGFTAGGDLKGAGLKAQLTAANQAIHGETQTAVPPAGVHGDPQSNSQEDHAKKVSQYRDGIDGIAGMIGDLDGFDDLCSAYGMLGDDSKAPAALASIKGSKAFHQLAQMWQGALDGGADSPAMQAAFEDEFARRGFWGSTQKAYQVVRDAAKAQAAEDARAAAAKKKAREAELKKQAAAAAAKDGGKAAGGKPNAPGVNAGAAGGANAALLGAVVPQQAAKIPAFDQLKAVSDGDFKHVMGAADHHAGLEAALPAMGAQSARTGQIWDQMKHAGAGFSETFVDTLKMGVIAHAGDKLLAGGVEKLIGEKVPIVGPVLQLAVDPPWKGKYWTDTGQGFADGWKSAKSAFDFSAFKGKSGLDFVGVLCAKLADLFTMFNQWVSVINKLIGTLSAVCLILGAVLIGVGIALCWLGIGEALMVAGGWLVEAGEILSDIALALVPITLALSAIALVFRTAAAFLVPSDIYAEQLAQEGEAAETFGKAAGTKAGLDTARVIETATPSKPKAAPAEAAGATTEATAAGRADGAALEAKAKADNDRLAQTAKEAQTKAQSAEGKPPATKSAKAADPAAGADPATRQVDDPKAASKKPGAEAEPAAGKDKPGDKSDDGKATDKPSAGQRVAELAKQVGRRVAESVKQSVDIGRNLKRLGGALGELGELGDPSKMADRGLSTRREGIEKHAKAAHEELEKLEQIAAQQKADLEATQARLDAEHGPMRGEDITSILDEVREAQSALDETTREAQSVERKLGALERGLARAQRGAADPNQPTSEETEGNASEDDAGGRDSKAAKRRAAEDQAAAKQKELGAAKAKQKALEREVERSKQAVETTKAQQADADAHAKAAVDQLEADPANAADKAASDKIDARQAALERAKELDRKAGDIDSAEQRRKNAEAALRKLIGRHVEVDGETGQITGITADGVTVKIAGVEKTVPVEKISGEVANDLKKEVDKLAKINERIAALTDGVPGGNAGSIAHDLHKTANDIKQRERVKNDAQAAQRGRDNAGSNAWKAKVAEAQAPASAADSATERAQKTLDQQEAELGLNREEQTKLQTELDEHKAEAARLRRAAQDHRSTEGWMENGASLGYGAVGWALQVSGLQDVLDRLWATVAGKQAPAKIEAPGKSEAPGEPPAKTGEPTTTLAAGKLAEGKSGEPTEPDAAEAEKLKAEALKVGSDQARYEELVAMRPPPEMALLGGHREKASLAAVRYHNAHEQAYACYQAELAIDKLQHDAGALASEGAPLQHQAQASRGPLAKSKDDEAQRQQALAGGQPGDVKGADSRTSGLVMGLVSKLADHSDQLSQQPSSGGTSPDAMASGQDKARDEANNRTAQGKGHSQGQAQFLDQALALNQKQDHAVGTNIQQLHTKQQQEIASRDAMRERKAAALAEEAAARAEVESESATFNAGYARAKAWATAYEAKRSSVKGGGGE